ncbi:MAG: prenyltransferase/squalene oxidase repeat-containing protein [Bacteroidota bacterium]
MNHKILMMMFLISAGCCSFTAIVGWEKGGSPPSKNNTVAIQTAVSKGFSLLQTSGARMIEKVRCASCHHTAMTSLIAATMEEKGITGIDTTAGLRENAMVGTLDYVGNPNLNHQFVSAKFLAPYILLGLHAEKHPADFNTDLAVNYIISQALPDGSFKAEYARVPLECGDIHLTAMAIRALDLYASKAKRIQVQQLLLHSKTWMEQQTPTTQQELSFQLMGMNWCGSNQSAKNAVLKKLFSLQNKDGGWSQLPSMTSDAYATGQVLYAMSQTGMSTTESQPFQAGTDYLLRTQDKTGAWIMVTRSNPIQPFVNTDFPPYDDNQFISAAGTNWAVLALATSLPDKK